MILDTVEFWLRWAGAVALAVDLAFLFAGMARALRRPLGRTWGPAVRALRWPVYLLIILPFLAVSFLLWRPLPLALPPPGRAAALVLGAVLYFPGLALVLWSRLALRDMYNVSFTPGVQLFADHRLIVHGPYGHVRHPIYAGVFLAAWGALLLYRLWTCVFLCVVLLSLLVRARREEAVLAAEFGAPWDAYCRRVPAWLPRLRQPRPPSAPPPGDDD